MWKHDPIRTGEPRAIDQAGVIQRIRADGVAGFRKCGEDREVGQISARKLQCALGSLERGETLFELREASSLSPQQARAGTPGAEFAHRRCHALFHPWMIGQAQIIVRRKVDTLGRPADPQQTIALQTGQVSAQALLKLSH
jgi:hypothetical protein